VAREGRGRKGSATKSGAGESGLRGQCVCVCVRVHGCACVCGRARERAEDDLRRVGEPGEDQARLRAHAHAHATRASAEHDDDNAVCRARASHCAHVSCRAGRTTRMVL
jgi:hypothetical protein